MLGSGQRATFVGAAEFLKMQFRFLARRLKNLIMGMSLPSRTNAQVNAGMPLVAPLGPWYKNFFLVAKIQSGDTEPRSNQGRG